MSKEAEKITVTLNGDVLDVNRGLTILQVAERRGIYIPTLCAHKDLMPFGACRMCVVEVEGIRGLPAACTTPVEAGMVIRTDSPEIRAARLDVLKLILSEHPSSCLICDEREECKTVLGTIRKVGVTTGCRYCPSDGQCELQDVVEKMGVDELDFPVTYRGLPVGKDDPFIERDYNLCILCGRCVRVCNEVRGANTLTFRQRGPETVVGTAYDRAHIDAGCEFCGDCVSVCPTGALSEKARRWEGVAEREETTTCPLCGVGCQIRLQVKGNKVIGGLPAEDPVVSNGRLCVKGRFCLPELLDNHRRLVRPMVIRNGGRLEVSMTEAVDLATEEIAGCRGDDMAMIVSTNCTSEDLYIAQKFARVVMGSNNIHTDAEQFFGDGFDAYIELMKIPGSLEDLRNASEIFCVGLDTRFSQSVVNIPLHEAADRGARIITINPHDHNLAMMADMWLKPPPGTEHRFFEKLLNATNGDESASSHRSSRRKSGAAGELRKVAAILNEADAPIIVVGSTVLQQGTTRRILGTIKKLAERVGARVVLMVPQNNLYGSILMGAYSELLPGGLSSRVGGATGNVGTSWGFDLETVCAGPTSEDVSSSSKKRKRLLYVIGDVPPRARPKNEFVICQNIYPVDADLVLPSAAFSEADGTFINGEGRIQEVRGAVNPPGDAIPNWQILCRIASRLGKNGFDFTDTAGIRDEIASLVEGYRHYVPGRREASEASEARPLECGDAHVGSPSRRGRRRKEYPFLLYTSLPEHSYMGFSLSDWVDGSKELFAEGIVDVNPADAETAGVTEGDEVVVTSPRFETSARARIVLERPEKTLRITLCRSDIPGEGVIPAKIRKRDV